MKRNLIVLIFLFAFPVIADSGLAGLLRLEPDSKVDKKMKLEGSNSDLTYSIKKQNNLVKSVVIDLHKALDPVKFIKTKEEGFCLAEETAGDAKMMKYYFFNKDGTRRYELTPSKKLKGIVIQEMPGAHNYKACTFDKFEVKEGVKS